MSAFIPWNSQAIDVWGEQHAEGQFIDLGGRRTHYVERGEGQPVVLIHGFNLDWHTWMRNIDHLAANFKVYAIDLWGQGYSTREPLNYGYDLFEKQLRLFMEVMNLQKTSLVGHSMGAGTSITFALRNREKVNKLVLVDSAGIPVTLPFRSKVFRMKGVAEFLLSLRTDMIRRMNLGDFWIHNMEAVTNSDYEKLTGYQKVAGSHEAVLSILRKDFFNTLEDEIVELGKLNISTLIIWGRQDNSLPFNSGEKMHQVMPSSKLEILEEAGHLANFDQAESFNELVTNFLS
ncbi:MAG: alpha/beta hydrolase [Chloroflexi bacterium]|nr:MAG: alpha/beta hydrolase [Chloroflexota bacterium]MBL1195597.1 alpha/beta hydrolase [Chloroflexota bacterium]NOH12884.1 alpha/beta hydrolase [Chloroflexota bacterium]